MHDAHDAAAGFSDERVHRFGGIEEACKGLFGNGRGNVGLVEDLIALPQRLPSGAVARLDGTNVRDEGRALIAASRDVSDDLQCASQPS